MLHEVWKDECLSYIPPNPLYLSTGDTLHCLQIIIAQIFGNGRGRIENPDESEQEITLQIYTKGSLEMLSFQGFTGC